jgi:ADP-ribosylglycohydrolase
MFVAHALGDALGVPHEKFKSKRVYKYTGRLEFRSNSLPMFKSENERKYFVIGQTSDDTEKTLNILRSIVKCKGYDRKDVIMAHLAWANHNTTSCMGTNTKSLFKGVSTLKGYESRYTKMIINGDISLSNGCMMSISPISLFNNREEIVSVDCSITNPHPIAIDACRVYVESLRQGLKGRSKKYILEHALDLCKEVEVRKTIQDAINGVERDVVTNKGYILHALWITFYTFNKFDRYTDAMSYIINIDNSDTDTNAAIAGALFGAYLGYDKLYDEQGDNINILLTCDTSKGDFERPSIYTIHDIKDLCRKLLVP